MNAHRSFKYLAACIMIILILSAFGEASNGNLARCGVWVFSHDPDEAVLTLKSDGRGSYFGTDIFWRDEGAFLYLESLDGQSFSLAYTFQGDSMTVYLPTLFTRISEIGEDGQIIGTWVSSGNSQSSFVFTENGRFMEDGIFTGEYVLDEETGSITLRYAGGFEDTTIFYSFYEGQLIVEYPWLLIPQN